MKTLPTIEGMGNLLETLRLWRQELNSLTKTPAAPGVPWNLSVTGQRGGIKLTWAVTKGADGYEVLRSDTGDFSSGVTIFPLRSVKAVSYFDAFAAVTTKYYKVRATSGPKNNPYSVKGYESGVVKATSIDASDTVTPPTTTRDTTTKQSSQVYSGRGAGNYRRNLE